jgi:hypothetical protein
MPVIIDIWPKLPAPLASGISESRAWRLKKGPGRCRCQPEWHSACRRAPGWQPAYAIVPPSQHCRCRARAVTAGPLQCASSFLGRGVRAFWPAGRPRRVLSCHSSGPSRPSARSCWDGTSLRVGVSSNRPKIWFFITSPKKPQSQVRRARARPGIPGPSGGQ